jgi:hypothetical protein
MKKIVKTLCFIVFSFLFSSSSFAQLKIPVANAFAADMKKVIREYPHQFTALQGEVIEENPQTVNYSCTVEVAGAEQATITKYSSGLQKQVYSWQALMLTTESFEEAKKKFRSLYTQFNNMAVKMDYGVTFYLKGKYEEPVEEKNFTSSILSFENSDQITHKMKVEIAMQYELMEWKVRVLIYDHERNDDERGKIEEQ